MGQSIALALGTISAFAACLAAIAAWSAAKETRRAAQAQTVASLLDAYSSPEMLAAIAVVKAWAPGAPVELGSEIDHARRRLSHHFQRIVTLESTGLLDRRFVPVVITKREAELFLTEVQALEKQLDSNYDREPFLRIKRLYANHPPTPTVPARLRTGG